MQKLKGLHQSLKHREVRNEGGADGLLMGGLKSFLGTQEETEQFGIVLLKLFESCLRTWLSRFAF